MALRKDPYFDWSQALLQIAIVLASVHLIIGNLMLLALSGGLAALGVLLMLNGFTLAVPSAVPGVTARPAPPAACCGARLAGVAVRRPPSCAPGGCRASYAARKHQHASRGAP